MATTSPPSPPAASPPPSAGRPLPSGRVRSPARWGRWLALAALAAVVVAIAYIVFGGKGGADYQLVFPEAGQLVKGDQVQVGGVPVWVELDGSVHLTNMTSAYCCVGVWGPRARDLVGSVSEDDLCNASFPYLTARRIFIDTVPVVAIRISYVGELGWELYAPSEYGLHLWDELWEAGRALGVSTEYFPPSLAAANHFFAELVRDQPVFTHFLVESAKAVTTIGARKEDLSGLIEHANTTFQAIGSEQAALTQGLRELPVTLKQGNVTFANLPSTFAALTRLVEASKPTSKPLTTLFSRLRPLVTTATPAVGNFNLAINRPGPNNDLTDIARALPGLARALSTSSPATVQSLKESVPVTYFFGPYSPDLEGTLRTFGQSGAYYDANGHYARVTPILPSFKLGENGTLSPTSPQQALENLKSGQLRRCPGGATQPAADKSSPFANELLTCDPLQTP